MNLQTIRNRRKTSESNMADLLISQQLYAQLEPIVKEEFEKNKRELYKKLNADYTESHKQLDNKCKELEKLLENKGESSQKDIEKALQEVKDLKTDMQTKHGELLNQFAVKKDIVLAEVKKKVDVALAEIEKQRGPQGIQGKPGRDGSPDTAKQVVEKVNKEGGVKITAIEGLLDKLETMKKLARGGGKSGGGMGDAKHETKNVNSSTTQITLDNGVAAGGNAIWMRYQGQMLVKGTDYNVNGKNVPLLFTPVDGTFIDVTYIRG